MSCPHSTRFDVDPSSCSQCVSAVVRHVTYDADSRQLKLDGQPVVRNMDGENRTPPNAHGSVSGRRQNTCGQCGATGHTRKTCNRQASTAGLGTAAMVSDD